MADKKPELTEQVKSLSSKLIENRVKTIEEFEKNYNLGKITPTLSYKIKEDENNYEIKVFDKNKHILTCEGKLIGTYNILVSTWYWAYALEYVNRNLILKKEDIDKLKDELKTDYKLKKLHQQLDKLYYLLSTPVAHMPGIFKEKYPFIANIALWILKSKGILFVPIGEDDDAVKLKDADKVKLISLFSVDKIKQIK